MFQTNVEVVDTPFFHTIVEGSLWELGFFYGPARPDDAPTNEKEKLSDPAGENELEERKRQWLTTADRLMPSSVRYMA